MKKTFKTMLAFMAGAMVFTACNKDDIYENNPEQNTSLLKPMTFYASMEGQGGATRATIDGLDIKWTTGDKISIFDGSSENNGNQEFTLTDGFGTTSGTFEGTAAEVSTYYALYPYSKDESKVPTLEEAEVAAGDYARYIENWKKQIATQEDRVVKDMNKYGISAENQAIILAYLKNETIGTPGAQFEDNTVKGVVFPAEQTVAEGQCVDPKAMLMIGKSDDANSIQFKNVCAYVKVTPQFDCTAIRLISKGAESLAGTVTLDYNDGVPTASVTENGVSKVSLTGTIKTGNAYYIAVLPATLESGFTIRFVTTDAIYNKSTTKVLALASNNVINLGSFDKSKLTSVPVTGTAKATISSVETDVNWVHLWEDGPKFAEYNVGVTDGKAESYGGYYQWGSSIDKATTNVYYEGRETLPSTYDTATNLWGSNWRMPTQAELQGLLDYCDVEWIDGSDKKYNGTNTIGLLCSGKKNTAFASNSVFLPAGGYSYYGSVSGSFGDYWSSTSSTSSSLYGKYYLNFKSGSYGVKISENIIYGYSVRAVLAE